MVRSGQWKELLSWKVVRDFGHGTTWASDLCCPCMPRAQRELQGVQELVPQGDMTIQFPLWQFEFLFTQGPLDGANGRRRKNKFLKNGFCAEIGESVEWRRESVRVSIFEPRMIHERS